MVRRRPPARRQAQPAVVLKFETRSLSWFSRLASAAVTFWVPLISRRRSPGFWPSSAWFTIAVPRSASGESSSESFSDSPAVSPRVSRSSSAASVGLGLAAEALAQALQELLEVLASVGLQRPEHLVELDRRAGLGRRDRLVRARTSPASGVPGLRSTKKLPSRKIRGRIFSSALRWIGSASSFELHRHDGGRGVVGRRPRPSTPGRPARRRCAPATCSWRLAALSKVAFSS